MFVSTIHKAKGREFENVYIVLDNFNIDSDEAKRQLYVAMTRAKTNLTVHINTNMLDEIGAEDIERFVDRNTYLPPREIAMHLTHSDVILGHFAYVQEHLIKLNSGDSLVTREDGLYNSKNNRIIRFSQRFREKLMNQKTAGLPNDERPGQFYCILEE
ncbi:MAG: ATP-binding domain-containing protein [Chitinophagaceae bacterium]|nr:ATP-binding domain-containing protein [Chitinophagaceae bacterium]